METKYIQTIRPILDAFDKISKILKEETIELPRIVVVGDQSSGKSSVLESITGISLPRGTGTVTKCPIIIQSRLAKDEHDEGAVISMEEFDDSPKINLKDLPRKIEEYQDKLITSKNGEITDTPININFRKLDAPDLTLYDLPGLTYKSNKQITDRIRDMIVKYTSSTETIILLIIASNTDICNTEAIELIKNNFDYKERTVAVLTKIDLAIQEKGLYQKIMNNELDLKYDPIVVRNRTQNEIDDKESIESVSLKEKQLIENSELSKLSENSKGTSALVKFLIEIQKEKLINSKYSVKEKINQKIRTHKGLLKKFPKSLNTLSDKMDRFKECLSKFNQILNDALENKYLFRDDEESDDETSDKKEMINITFVVRNLFEGDLKRNFQDMHKHFLSKEFFDSIQILVQKSRGFNLPNFNEFATFKSIMARKIDEIEITNLMDSVKEKILKFLYQALNEAFNEYPELFRVMALEIEDILNDQHDKAESFINDFLSMEKSTIYTINPYYMDMLYEFKEVKRQKADLLVGFDRDLSSRPTPTITTENEMIKKIFNDFLSTTPAHYDKDTAVVDIQTSCFAYWKVFEKRFVDYFHITIINKMVFFFKDNLSNILDKKFSPNSNDNVQKWIKEELTIVNEREKNLKSLKNFEEAKEIIDRI